MPSLYREGVGRGGLRADRGGDRGGQGRAGAGKGAWRR